MKVLNTSQQMNDGGPAFPTDSERQNGENSWHFPGMSLRDYFAAVALQGFCADSNRDASFEGDAKMAYKQADAMLAERAKQ